MDKERERRHKSYAQSVGLFLACLALSLPLINLNTSSLAIQALLGKEISCLPESVETNREYPYDAIAVPGAGVNLYKDGTSEPNMFGRRRLTAAALAYVNGLAPNIILLDGMQGATMDYYIDKRYLDEQIRIHQPKNTTLDPPTVYIDPHSVNTKTNMEVLKETADTYGFRRILVVTDAFHEGRAMTEACSQGIGAESLSVEDIAALFDPQSLAVISEQTAHKNMWVRNMKERIGLISLMFADPLGNVSKNVKMGNK